MNAYATFFGALLLAAPVFSQPDEITSFQLNETREEVTLRLGRPALVTASGELESWQYQIGVEDNHEFSHILVFRGPRLVSVTRNWELERRVDELFPPADTKSYDYPRGAAATAKVRVRRLSGGRVLLTTVTIAEPSRTGQVVLMREEELGVMLPSLELE